MTEFTEIWTYLSRGPLLWLTATLAAYGLGDALSRATGRHPLANPVPVAVVLLACLLGLTATPYATYFEGAQFVHFLLGPATVALALPLWEARAHVRRAALPVLAALVAGSATAVVSAVVIARAGGVGGQVLASIAPKSVTAPVAIGISEAVGGLPTLTAVFVLMTGVLGAVMVTPILNALRLRDWRARGFAAGVAAHGLGTARAFQVNPVAGAFAGLAMGLNAILSSFLVPPLLRWLTG